MINAKKNIVTLLLGSIVLFAFISMACILFDKNQPPIDSKPAIDSQENIDNPVPYPDSDPGAVEKPMASSEPDPEPDPDPDPEPLVSVEAKPTTILAKGFGQNGQEVGYGFKVKNPNPDVAFEDSQYQIAVYDAHGTVLQTDGGYINIILQNQEVGIGGSIYLDGEQKAAKIEVQFNDGRAVTSDLSNLLTTDKITYSTNEFYSTAKGVIINGYDQDISYLEVSALFYNNSGEIIGGGTNYLNFLSAKSSSGVIIPVAINGEVSRVELFPTITGFFEMETSGQYPEGANKLEISKQGYGQRESSVGYGMMLKNSNQGYAIEGSMYHLTAYSANGNVLGVYDGYVDLILPDQILGLGSEIYLEGAESVSRIDVQIKEGIYTPSNVVTTMTSENVTFMPGDYLPEVTGEIINPYNKEVTNVPVFALALDETGEIIGAGSTILDFVPANGKSAVAVNITLSGVPATVELFAGVRSLSDIGG